MALAVAIQLPGAFLVVLPLPVVFALWTGGVWMLLWALRHQHRRLKREDREERFDAARSVADDSWTIEQLDAWERLCEEANCLASDCTVDWLPGRRLHVIVPGYRAATIYPNGRVER